MIMLIINEDNFFEKNFVVFGCVSMNQTWSTHTCPKSGRIFYYNNCEKIFTQKTSSSKNSELYERKIICFPNHRKISKVYMDYIIKKVKNFYDESSSDKY